MKKRERAVEYSMWQCDNQSGDEVTVHQMDAKTRRGGYPVSFCGAVARPSYEWLHTATPVMRRLLAATKRKDCEACKDARNESNGGA